MKIEIVLSVEERRRCRDRNDVFREELLHALGAFVYARPLSRVRIYNEKRMPLLAWDEGERWPPIYRDELEELTCPACGKEHVDDGELAAVRHRTHTCVADVVMPGCGHVWTLDRYVFGVSRARAAMEKARTVKGVKGGE
jgi:hypothetical protein